MENVINEITSIIAPALITAIGILITWGLNELRRFVKNKTDNREIDAAFDQLDKIIKGTVIKAEQVMKKYGADGKITEDEAREIKRSVVADIKCQLPLSTEVFLKKVINDVDALIDTRVEVEVYKLKEAKKL